MLQQQFEYWPTKNPREAAERKRSSPGILYIAGGTDVVPLLQYGLLAPPALIPVGGFAELGRITVEDGRLSVGAAITLHALCRDARERPALRGLAAAAAAVASPQIRRIGTVAGNLLQERRCYYFNQSAGWRAGIDACFQTAGAVCHQAPASPICRALYYSDLAPMLIAMGAALRAGGRERPLEAVCGAPQALGDDLAEAVLIPDWRELTFTAFHKVAVRGAIDFALANAALAMRADGGVRLVLGAMNPQPVALPATAKQVVQALAAREDFPAALYECAEKEARSLARPIREAGVTGAVKMGAASSAVLQVIRELEQSCAPR